METGMFRKNADQIQTDMRNQENTRQLLESILSMEIKPQHEFSTWDWEVYEGNELKAIVEYRRRFINFGTYPDFQFSKKKFYLMKQKALSENIGAYMVVEFNNGLKFFTIDGEPEEKVMQRRGEQRTEQVVVIHNSMFQDVKQNMKGLL